MNRLPFLPGVNVRRHHLHTLLVAAAILPAFSTQAEEAMKPATALVGRWLGRNPYKRGDYEGYNGYIFTSAGNFAVIQQAFNTRTKKWSPAEQIFKEAMKSQWPKSLAGSYQAAPPKFLLLKASVLLSEMPIDLEYQIEGDTLTLRQGRDSLPWLATVCKRVSRFDFEPEDSKTPEHDSMVEQLDQALGSNSHPFHFDPKSSRWTEHPLDEVMIRTFQEHRQEFETLRDMLRQDKGLNRVGSNWTRPDDPATIGISKERLEQYRKLFHTLDLESGVADYRNDQSVIEFLASCVGMFDRGSCKGYAWLASPPVAVEDLDAYVVAKRKEWQRSSEATGHAPKDNFTAYRHIEANWYLYYEH